jgi:dTDP-4-amino-4,6-dideoxygalactose transaminase
MSNQQILFDEPETNFTNSQFVNNFLELFTNQSDITPIENFKKFFSKYIKHKYILPTSTGSSALHLAMCAIDLKRGDKILCSVNSFASIPEVVRHFDAEPIFVDINKNNLHIDFDQLEEKIKQNYSKKLRGIIVHHIGGEYLDIKRLHSIAEKHNLYIIEDATTILGSKNVEINEYSDIKVFRFDANQPNSPVNGGVFATNNFSLHKRANLLSYHGISREDLQESENMSLDYFYDLTALGCEYRMSQLDATYHFLNIKNRPEHIAKRQKIAKIYYSRLKNIKHISFPETTESNTFYYFIVQVDKNRDGFARELKERGINTSLHYPSLHLLTYYKTKYDLKVNDFPSALKMYQQVLSLPIHHSLNLDEVNKICDSIIEISEKHI